MEKGGGLLVRTGMEWGWEGVEEEIDDENEARHMDEGWNLD